MKTIVSVILLGLFTSVTALSQTQHDFAKLERNINERAKGLKQSLNVSKDTLVLKSDRLISKVYSVSMDQQREVDMVVNDHEVEIPLTTLSKGKHIFVTVQNKRRIVFVVKVYGNDNLLLASNEKKPKALKNKN